MKRIKQAVITLALLGLLGTSLILNFFQLGRIDELSRNVIELQDKQVYLENYINQLHNIDGNESGQ